MIIALKDTWSSKRITDCRPEVMIMRWTLTSRFQLYEGVSRLFWYQMVNFDTKWWILTPRAVNLLVIFLFVGQPGREGSVELSWPLLRNRVRFPSYDRQVPYFLYVASGAWFLSWAEHLAMNFNIVRFDRVVESHCRFFLYGMHTVTYFYIPLLGFRFWGHSFQFCFWTHKLRRHIDVKEH